MRGSQRASLLGGEVATSVQAGLEAVRADFSAFQRLRSDGKLPTLVEQISEPLEAAAGRGGCLGAFDKQEAPVEQRAARSKRRQTELEAKQLKLAAALG